MDKFTVQFSRSLADDREYADRFPWETEGQLRDQLRAELDGNEDGEVGLLFYTLEPAVVTAEEDEYIITGTFLFDGDRQALREKLQELYDVNGVAGFFEIQ